MTLDNNKQQNIILDALNTLASKVGQNGLSAQDQQGRTAKDVYRQIADVYEDVEDAEINSEEPSPQ